MASTDGLFSRLMLDRLLGPGLFRITDNSAGHQERHLVFGCGCLAREQDADRFDLAVCADHRELVSAERFPRSVEVHAP